MKTLYIALKDLIQSLRNYFFLGFGLGAPLLMGVIFYFAFGGLAHDEGFQIPQTDVRVVNLDEPVTMYGGFSAGKMLAEFLQSEELSKLLATTEAADPAAARAAVDARQADVAVIIPAEFSAAVFDPQGRAEIEVYHDPTLTIGPGIVKSIVTQFVDVLVGSTIAASVADEQLSARGAPVDVEVLQRIAMEYGQWSTSLASAQGMDDLLTVQPPPGQEKTANQLLAMIGVIMAGMMVFYAFYTGAATAMSILYEEEGGTLGRLFTTPTPMSAILGGKLIAVFAVLLVQVAALMAFSSLLFKTDWGAPAPLALAILGLVALAGSFGIFIMSWLKDTRQTGVILGGGMTVIGMAGISSVFTRNVPGAGGGFTAILPLLVPQGWAMRAWITAIDGGAVGDALLSFGVMIALSVIFFSIGVLRFRKRLL